MEPVYMNMQSYPHQDPLHYRPRCYSGMEPCPPMSYGCWPWGSNYGYAAPGACHGCSNHAYTPVAWGSPFSHVPPHHCPGNYPYFPAQYMPLPPYNVMEHPRYEYEKNVPMEHHFCGCPNHHPLYPKEQKTARIEEEEPERERERERERESRKNDSLIPLQIKNSPYPIVWLPPDYKEHGKVQNAEGRKDASRDVKVREDEKTAGHQPPSLKGWLPVDLNNVLSSKKRGDGEENVPQDGGKQNFQFPLFWIPYKPDDMEHESHKVKDVNLKPSLELEKGSDDEQKFHVNRGNVGDQTASRVKDIPVKEAEQLMRKESSIIQEKERDTSVRDRTDKGEKKIETVDKEPPTEGSKRKSPSPPKSSKLPPVCLRVDRLPRKKSANGKLRSPSPPGDKQKLEVKSNEASKPRSLDSGEPVKEAKDAKTVAVVDGSASPEESMNVNVETLGKLPAKSKDDVSMKQAEVKPEEEQVAQKQAEHDAVVKGQSQDIVSAKGENEEPLRADGMEVVAVNKRRELSEEEAAVIIQSAYRRFNVCRWKPVEKLKLIARVREQIADVKRLIQELELSSDIQGRAKQKNFIAETIMSLLLKLDTIQGLHPSIREVRKSVVRELVSLQEQLDSLPEISPTNESMMRCDHEDASNKSEDATTSESGNEINSVDLQNQIDGRDNSEEVNLVEKAAGLKIGMEVTSESSVDEGVKAAQIPATKDEDEEEESSEVLQNNETSIAKEHHETINHGQASELSCLVDESSDRVTDSAPDDHDVVQSELAELPQGVLDDLDRSAVEADSSVSDHSKHVEEALIGSPGVQEPHQETANEENHQTMEAHKASAVEEDSSIADHSKHVEEALIGSPSVQQPHHETADEENHQAMEAHEASDLPLDGAELGTEQTEIGGSLDNKFEEEVYSRGGDARSEPNEHTPQQLENVTAILIEPSERELPTVEACTTNDKSLENSASTMEEEPLESLPEEGDLEKTNPTNDAVNMDEVERAAEAESNDVTDACIAKQTVAVGINHSGAGASEESLPQITEACQPGEAEHEEDNTDKGSPGEDDIRERNRRLMEENERLREMMKKLIKSGQEQLTAISSLSGRVKDMEKRLSRKKKMKVKQYKAPKSSKFDREKKTIHVAL